MEFFLNVFPEYAEITELNESSTVFRKNTNVPSSPCQQFRELRLKLRKCYIIFRVKKFYSLFLNYFLFEIRKYYINLTSHFENHHTAWMTGLL